MGANAELMQMDIETYMADVGQRARAAARAIGRQKRRLRIPMQH
jgi:hypothetical protein